MSEAQFFAIIPSLIVGGAIVIGSFIIATAISSFSKKD